MKYWLAAAAAGALGFGTACCVQAAEPGSPAEVELGNSYPAVNGTTIRCPIPVPPSAEQQAGQFETRPKDLDALSEMVKKFTDPTNPVGAEFRAKQADQRANDWPYLCRYRDANAALIESGKRPDVVFMGDSITEGWINADPAFFADHNYVDRGISGQSTPQMVARFYDDVVALHPRVVHIMTGTNDIGGATGPITDDDYVGYLRSMIAIARANGIGVVLASMPPMSRLLPRPDFDVRPVVPQLNRRVAQLAAEYDLIYIDYFSPLVDAQGGFDPRYANDGVHPTRAGYAIMEPLAEQAIGRALASQ